MNRGLSPELVLLSLTIVGSYAIQWDAIDTMTNTISGYNDAAERVIHSVEYILRNSTADASVFLSNLDDLSIVKEINSIPEGDKCKELFVDLKALKNSFKLHFSQLEGPILRRITDIKSRFNDIKTSMLVYQGLAEGKLWACKIDGEDCMEETKNWVDESMQSLACKVTKNCMKKTIAKREVSISCQRNQYIFEGICYDVDRLICDGECDEGRRNGRRYVGRSCRDEPPDCKRYCVGGFHCSNLKCLDKNIVCDGTDDCGDGSDEHDCEVKIKEISPSNCSLEAGKFLCNDKTKCLDVWSSCDGQVDCADGSDEGGSCGVGDCLPECRAAGGVCLDTPRGKLCLSHCPPGTSETLNGCSPGPSLPPHTLAGLLDDLPRLSSRYLASFKLLQSRLVEELSASLTQVSECRSDSASLGGVVRLSDFITTAKYPHTTTKHPHTTTKHPHTTTKHPHTITHHTTTPSLDLYDLVDG